MKVLGESLLAILILILMAIIYSIVMIGSFGYICMAGALFILWVITIWQ